MAEDLAPFDRLEAAVHAARAAVQRAARAEETAKRARYECGRMKVQQDSYGYGGGNTPLTPEQEAVRDAMVEARLAETERVVRLAYEREIRLAAEALDGLRATIPHLIPAAMVDLGGRSGALHDTLAFSDRAPDAEQDADQALQVA